MNYETIFIEEATHFSEAFYFLNEFRQTGELCDIYLQAGASKVNAHKAVLAACSPYFRAMFTADFLEAKQPFICMKGTDGRALEDIVNYFYTGKISINALNVEGVLGVANALQLESLVNHCETYMRRNISLGNCFGLYSLAKFYGLTDLDQQALRFISWYFADIPQEGEFLLLPSELLKQLVANQFLKVPSEEFLLEAVMKWLFHDLEKRKIEFNRIIPEVRFSLMNPNYLAESVCVKFLMKNFTLGQQFIKEALLYQSTKGKTNDKALSNVIANRFKARSSSEDIYVIGGWSDGQKLSSVQCFNLDTLKWSTLQNMRLAHVSGEDYFRVIVSNEQLYSVSQHNVSRYDAVDGKWSCIAHGPEIQCKWAGLCECNGYLYLVGGNSSKICKCFDTNELTWFDLPVMTHSRYYPGVGVMMGKIYVVGGLDHNWMSLKSCERYDPKLNQWEVIRSMKVPRWSLGVAVVENQLYAIGGNHNVEQYANSVELYNPNENKWFRGIAPLNYGRRNHGVAVVNGTIYVVGGRVANTIESYNKEANVWTVTGSVPTCCNFSCVALRMI
eukprot:gene9687-10677_t